MMSMMVMMKCTHIDLVRTSERTQVTSIRKFKQLTLHTVEVSVYCKIVGQKSNHVQTYASQEGSRRMRLPDFKTVGIRRWKGCQTNEPAAFKPQAIFLELISVRG